MRRRPRSGRRKTRREIRGTRCPPTGWRRRAACSCEGVEATGAVRLLGAKLGGDLACVGATFRAEKDAAGNPGDALSADGLEARGDVCLDDFEATGAVRLLGAKLDGSLECDGATFRAEKDAEGKAGNALSADRLEARANVFLRGVTATGEVRLLGAKLGGNLECDGATFRAEKDAEGNAGRALNLDGARVSGAFSAKRSAYRRRAGLECCGHR